MLFGRKSRKKLSAPDEETLVHEEERREDHIAEEPEDADDARRELSSPLARLKLSPPSFLKRKKGKIGKKASSARKKPKKHGTYAEKMDDRNLRPVSIGGKRFLLGLSWSNLPLVEEDKIRDVTIKSMREECRKNRETVHGFCLEKPQMNATMTLFGTSSWYERGFHALLPIVTQSRNLFLKETTVAEEYGKIVHVFQLEDMDGELFYWIVYVNSAGMLDSMSDRCIAYDEQTLEVVLSQFRSYIIGQNEENIEDEDINVFKHDSIESLRIIKECIKTWYKNLDNDTRIHPVIINYKPFIFLGLAVVVLGLAGWYGNEWWEEQQRLEQERLLQQQSSAYAKKKIAEETKRNFPRVWEDQPKVALIYPLIRQAMIAVPAEYNGWVLKQATWSKSANFIDAEYQRKDKGVPRALPNEQGNFVRFDQKNGKTRFPVWRTMPQKRGKDESLTEENIVQTYLYNIIPGRLWKGKGSIKPVEKKTISIPQGKQNVKINIEAEYRLANLVLEGLPFLTEDLWKYLDFPGLVLDRIVKTPKGYSISASIYLQK